MKMEAGSSGGNCPMRSSRASIPPEDVPITMMLRPLPGIRVLPFCVSSLRLFEPKNTYPQFANSRGVWTFPIGKHIAFCRAYQFERRCDIQFVGCGIAGASLVQDIFRNPLPPRLRTMTDEN